MVIKNFVFAKEKVDFLKESKVDFPEQFKKEILILQELGLEDYEIEYIIYLKTKELARQKWG